MAMFCTIGTVLFCLLFGGVVSQVNTCYEKADILFVMDASGSVLPDNFQKQLQFAATFINNFQIGPAQFAVLRFDDLPYLMFDFDDYKDVTSLKNAILKISYTAGGTNTAAALRMAREQAFQRARGARPGVAKIAIVSTDGLSFSPNDTAIEAELLRNSSVLVLAMGIGPSVNKQELDAIASYSEDVFEIPNYLQLLSIVQDYSELVCSEAKLFKCYNDSDVFYLIDSSTKIQQVQFQNAIRYAQTITASFDLSVMSFGAATFGGSTVQSLFKLGQIIDRYQLAQTFSTAVYTGGATDTNAALNWVRTQNIFDPANGGRANAIKILVIFTDGSSTTRAQATTTASLLRATGVNIITVGVANPNIAELQELVGQPALDVVTNLANTNVAVSRLQTLTAVEVCTLPGTAVRSAEDACRLYNWENGIHPHPYDCTKYIECTYLKTDIMPCAPPLEYDPVVQTCNYPGFITTPCNAMGPNTTFPPLITPAPTTPKPCVKGMLDILYLMDSSDNVGNPGFGEILRFAANLAESFHIGPDAFEFSASLFGTNPLNLFDFNVYNDYKPLQQAILNSTYLGGSTNTFLALQDAKNIFTTAHGSRDGTPKLAIVFTSGRSSDSQQTLQQATDLKNAGVHVISVGFNNPNLQELQAIASSPSEAFVNNLNGVVQDILDYSKSTCQVTVCVGIQFADVIFVLDSSNSISDSDYKLLLDFVADVTDNFQLGSNDVRFGGLIFSQDPLKLFDLDEFDAHDRLRSAILSATHMKSGTDTAKALNYVADSQMFASSAGGRDNATKILIILTDGQSNSVNDTIRAAQRLKATGVKFISIGVGDLIYEPELRQLASDNQSLFLVQGFDALAQIKGSVTRRTCEIPKDTPNVPDYSYVCASFRWADGQHPNPYDCSTYVICESFVTTVFSCSVGDAYDPVLAKCTDKVVAHPCNDPAYFGPSVTLPPVVTTRAPVDIGNICGDYMLADGLYPDPGSCHHFAECTAFNTQVLACPEGLNFNTVNSVCDDVHVVDCNVNYNYFSAK